MATRWFILLAVILAACDQFSKELARMRLEESVRHEIIPGFFRITLNFNSGIAWGMLPEYSSYLTFFAIIMVIVILVFMRKLERDEVWLKISLAFMMAGAIGNMIDRLLRGEVTDFLDVRLFMPGTSWTYDWPIFNLADSYIVVGATILFFIVFLSAGDTILTKKKPEPVKDSGALGPIGDSSGWVDGPEIPGSIPKEEALVELPISQQEELLRPIEEADQVRREVIGEPIGSDTPVTPDETVSKSDVPSEPDQLDELSRHPEPVD
ncbi:MAG TPA: signal peptidase II [Firmicutes bacterium]|nr:signal peptidase II [Bacillota bacterium]